MQTTIYSNKRCNKCHWPVIFALCNDEMSCDSDYWNYCSNKGCENHTGESVFQNDPDWVECGEPK